MTRNPEIRFAKSIVDYIFRWLATKFLSNEAQFHAGVNGRELEGAASADELTLQPTVVDSAGTRRRRHPYSTIQNQEDAPPCSHLRLDHDPQRRLLQVQQLRQHLRMCVGTGNRGLGAGGSQETRNRGVRRHAVDRR